MTEERSSPSRPNRDWLSEALSLLETARFHVSATSDIKRNIEAFLWDASIRSEKQQPDLGERLRDKGYADVPLDKQPAHLRQLVANQIAAEGGQLHLTECQSSDKNSERSEPTRISAMSPELQEHLMARAGQRFSEIEDALWTLHSYESSRDDGGRHYSEADITRMVEAVRSANRATFDLIAHLHRQRAFSERTFGPGSRAKGVVAHIRKELTEIEADPADLYEWVDVILLALDGAWRAGHSPEAIAQGIGVKQAKNEARRWPDWRTASEDGPIEHARTL